MATIGFFTSKRDGGYTCGATSTLDMLLDVFEIKTRVPPSLALDPSCPIIHLSPALIQLPYKKMYAINIPGEDSYKKKIQSPCNEKPEGFLFPAESGARNLTNTQVEVVYGDVYTVEVHFMERKDVIRRLENFPYDVSFRVPEENELNLRKNAHQKALHELRANVCVETDERTEANASASPKKIKPTELFQGDVVLKDLFPSEYKKRLRIQSFAPEVEQFFGKQIVFIPPLAPDATLEWYRDHAKAVLRYIQVNGLFDERDLSFIISKIVVTAPNRMLIKQHVRWIDIPSGDNTNSIYHQMEALSVCTTLMTFLTNNENPLACKLVGSYFRGNSFGMFVNRSHLHTWDASPKKMKVIQRELELYSADKRLKAMIKKCKSMCGYFTCDGYIPYADECSEEKFGKLDQVFKLACGEPRPFSVSKPTLIMLPDLKTDLEERMKVALYDKMRVVAPFLTWGDMKDYFHRCDPLTKQWLDHVFQKDIYGDGIKIAEIISESWDEFKRLTFASSMPSSIPPVSVPSPQLPKHEMIEIDEKNLG